MNANAVQGILRKDLKVVFQNKGVSVPLIAAPVFIVVVLLPGVAVLAGKLGDMVTSGLAWLDRAIEVMPAGFQAALAGYDAGQRLCGIDAGLLRFGKRSFRRTNLAMQI